MTIGGLGECYAGRVCAVFLALSSAAEPGNCPCCCWIQYVCLVLPCTLELYGCEGAHLHRVISSLSLLQFLISAACLSKRHQDLAGIKWLPLLSIRLGGILSM